MGAEQRLSLGTSPCLVPASCACFTFARMTCILCRRERDPCSRYEARRFRLGARLLYSREGWVPSPKSGRGKKRHWIIGPSLNDDSQLIVWAMKILTCTGNGLVEGHKLLKREKCGCCPPLRRKASLVFTPSGRMKRDSKE